MLHLLSGAGTANLNQVFEVGRWRVDPLGNTLTSGSEARRLEPKVVWVLGTLADRPGEIVTRQELFEEVWRGRPVTDEVLSRCISLLRSALGDDPKHPTYIQTIPGVGYRLVASVRLPGFEPDNMGLQAAQPPDRSPGLPSDVSAREHAPVARLRRLFRWGAIGAAAGFWLVQAFALLVGDDMAPKWLLGTFSVLMTAIFVAVVTVAWLRVARPRGRAWFRVPMLRGSRADSLVMAFMLVTMVFALGKPFLTTGTGPASSDVSAPGEVPATVIAVLPFENVGASPDSDYFSDGLTDELVTSLSRVEGLKVVARTTSSAMKGSIEDARTVGRKLGVSRLVSGTVRMDGSKLRISVQLVDAKDGYELWSQSYDATLEEIFTVQNEIATAIVAAVTPMLEVQAAKAFAANGPTTQNKDAYVMFLRARHILKRREEEPIRHAVALLQEAVALDPTYAAAYVELAHAYALLPYYSSEPQQKMFDLAHTVIATGRERGAAIGDAAEGLSAFIAFRSWQWIRAEESFRKAFGLDPNDPELHQWYSQFQASLGNAELSLVSALRAKEIDALSPVVNDRLAVAYLWSNEDDLAERQFEEAALLGLGPSANPRAHLVLLLRRQRYAQALGLMQAIQARLGGSTDWVGVFIAAQEDVAQREAAVQALAEAERTGGVKPRLLFGAWIYLGELDRAMEVANGLIADRASFDVEFLFSREAADFRQHPGFGELLTAIGIDKYWDAYGWPAACLRDGDEINCNS
jgi:TolB-like protein/DNA-binding winged helix-turn-helix (wHTH) protein